MSAFVVVTFPNEETLHAGMDELRRLRADRSINLYSSGAIARDPDGKLSVQEITTEGFGTTAAGALIGGLAGLPLGPAGVMIGAASGALIGNSAELVNQGHEGKLVDELSRELAPGKTAIVAELDEDGLTAFEAAMRRIGGALILK